MRVSSSLIVVTLSLAHHAIGYGILGHKTIGLLAQRYLTEENAAFLDKVLEGDDYGDAAVWADTVKMARPFTKEWHYIDAQDRPPVLGTADPKCFVSYPEDCTNKEHHTCIIDAITNQTSLFLDPSSSARTRQEALKFIMHMVGDLHQPLHTEDAHRGGNEITPVCFGRACANNNLHSVWDKDIPHKICGLSHSAHGDAETQAAIEWADKLFNATIAPQDECADIEFPSKCTLAWAGESNRFVCKVVLNKTFEWFTTNDLSKDYYTKAAPVVEYLVGIAGVRLGGYMNALAAAAQARASSPDFQEVLGDAEL